MKTFTEELKLYTSISDYKNKKYKTSLSDSWMFDSYDESTQLMTYRRKSDLPPEGVVVMSTYENGYEIINWIENGKWNVLTPNNSKISSFRYLTKDDLEKYLKDNFRLKYDSLSMSLTDLKNLLCKKIENEEKVIECKHLPLSLIVEVMESLGYEMQDIETNGWEVDYWTEFKKEDITYKVSGGLVYGDCKIEKV
jgi:hypothetical protein